ncbi:MAG TPA: inorganic phosphate transporter [Bacteroidetes bacterium]|nr:inorganic phosphate transporter [Bacteroidota bacterium]
MSVETILMIIVVASGFYMAWSVGANDVANAMGTSVGSGALTVKRAVILAAILEFMGAFFVGTHVSETIRKGIISPEIFTGNPLDLVFGMIGALLAAAIWLQIASYFGWPVSTTHSIVGAVLGFGVMYGGVQAADWSEVVSIVMSWVASPLLSGTVAFLTFSAIRRLIFYNDDPITAAKKITPVIVFLVFFVLTLAMVFKGLKNLKLDMGFGEATLVAIGIGAMASAISTLLVRRIKPLERKAVVMVKQPAKVMQALPKVINKLNKISENAKGELKEKVSHILAELEETNVEVTNEVVDENNNQEYKVVERIFVYLQILSAGFVAFAHGANDVANAVGPIAAVISILQTGLVGMKTAVPLWVLGLGGIGIVFGLATWGWRVMITIGKKITELTPTRGFSAEFATASTIVIASKLGIPISTTHTLVGGVLGVGLARGIGALNLRVVTNIMISWVVTIPIGAAGAIMFYYILKAIFG